MKTTLLTPETDENAVKTAAELIRAGEVVGMPTETVYGLAANALNGEAVKKIFLAKGRPQDNPLIVHIADFEQIYDLCPAVPPQAKQLAEAGEPEGILLVADEQTNGKGRRGRKWCSKKGANIFMTLLIRPKTEPKHLSGITLLAAMSVTGAIKDVCGADTKIKWPNDIVLEKKKICGILTEMSSEMNYVNYAVIGIGINVNDDDIPDELRKNASSIYLETGKMTNRNKLTAKVVEKFDEYYKKFLETNDLSQVVDKYNSMLISMDSEVKVLYGMAETADPKEEETGIARGIDKDGALLVETKDGIKSIVSGEVSVRGLYGYV